MLSSIIFIVTALCVCAAPSVAFVSGGLRPGALSSLRHTGTTCARVHYRPTPGLRMELSPGAPEFKPKNKNSRVTRLKNFISNMKVKLIDAIMGGDDLDVPAAFEEEVEYIEGPKMTAEQQQQLNMMVASYSRNVMSDIYGQVTYFRAQHPTETGAPKIVSREQQQAMAHANAVDFLSDHLEGVPDVTAHDHEEQVAKATQKHHTTTKARQEAAAAQEANEPMEPLPPGLEPVRA